MDDVRRLYLLMTITFLALLSALFLSLPDYYNVALFSTISLPAVYSARYFAKKEEEGKMERFKFFRKYDWKKEVATDLVAVLSAYLIGYMWFIATSRYFETDGLILYTIAFIVVLVLRYLITVWTLSFKQIVDIENPFFVAFSSIILATIGMLLEVVFFSVVW